MARLICPDLFPRFSSSFVCPLSVNLNPGMSLFDAMYCYWKVKKWGITYSGTFSSGESLSGYQEIDVGIRKVRDQESWPSFTEQGQKPASVDSLVCLPGKAKVSPEPSLYVLNELTGEFEPQPLPEWGPYFQESGVFDDGTPYTIRTYNSSDFYFRDRTEVGDPFCQIRVEGKFSRGSKRHNGLYFNGPEVEIRTDGGIGIVYNAYGNTATAGLIDGGVIKITSGSRTIAEDNLYNNQTSPIGNFDVTLNALEFFSYA